MADRGILFSAPMVLGLLREVDAPGDGKSQTRRTLAQPPECVTSAGVISRSTEGQTDEWWWLSGDPEDCDTWMNEGDFHTGFRPGDRLWVRETYYQRGHWEPVAGKQTKRGGLKWGFVPETSSIWFDPPGDFRKAMHRQDPATSALHMVTNPRWAATVHYRADAGLVDVTHDLDEIADLHDLVERGPHWDTIEQIVIVRALAVPATLTIEEARRL